VTDDEAAALGIPSRALRARWGHGAVTGDEADLRKEAEGFARSVSTCLVTLDMLPPEWQRRAVAIITAAYKGPCDEKRCGEKD
jgi:hypothetical protein